MSELQVTYPPDMYEIATNIGMLMIEVNIKNNSTSIVTGLLTPLVLLDSPLGCLSTPDDVQYFREFLITCNTLLGTSQ